MICFGREWVAIIIAQTPKMMPHIPVLTENIASDLCFGVECANVKATTTTEIWTSPGATKASRRKRYT